MIKFELLDNNKYKFQDNIFTADKLAKMISEGTIKEILKLDDSYSKNFWIESKIDLSNTPEDSPLSTMQTIYFGAPGTGKSYKVSEVIKKYYPNYNEKKNTNRNIFRTTIHSEYSYYDFVGNILPVSEDNKIDYKFVPGIFTNALFQAFQTDEPVFLVLEEMSRGNIAAIFGDLFQLLDRDEDGNSDYSINHSLICKFIREKAKRENIIFENKINEIIQNNTIYLPSNLHFLGTVNTSDQNVFVMDTAFKRRFQMKYVSLNVISNEKGIPLNNEDIKIGSLKTQWCKFYPKLNKYIVEQMGHAEDKQIGQFFLKFKTEDHYDFNNCDENQIRRIKEHIREWNQAQIIDKLLLYLWQDIEKSNYKNKKLFNNDIKSFGDLIEKAEFTNESVFSDDFLNVFFK